MPKQNVFFFNAEGGQTDPKATTQADLLAWINAMFMKMLADKDLGRF